MKPVRWAICAALWLPGLAVSAAQRDTPQRPGTPGAAAAGRATLTGRVVSASDGRALKGALVEMTGPGGPRSTLTDAEGRFTIPELITGRWTASVSKAGFVTQQSGQRHPFQPPRPFQVTAGERYSIDFALARSGAISGTITDQFGEPVAGVQVNAIRARIVAGRRRFNVVVTSDLTDDTGAFRLHSLPTGDYYVSATTSGIPASVVVLGVHTNPTYFPGTPSTADAQRITLAAGEERSAAFSITSARAVRVSGIVVDSRGASIDGVTVELLDAADLSFVARPFGNFGQSQEGGRFTLINVAPGAYVITANEMRPSGLETAFVPITVSGEEITGVTVAMSRGVTLTGSVAAAHDAVLPASFNASITAHSVRGREVRTASIEGGRFTLPGLLGPMALTVDELPAGWTVQSIDLNGIDVADDVLDFPSAGEVTARVVVTNRSAEVAGVVSFEKQPLPDVDVLIFPDDSSRWAYPSRLVRAARADAAGRYRVAGLPPAPRYLAIALDYMADGEQHDPELLERLRGRAIPFSLVDGEKKMVDLSIVGR
jgi:hypothetical protein